MAELEAKSYSSTVENENLRSILKRLQEENVSLKQSAFTFAMPRAGASGSGSGSTANNSPVNNYSSGNNNNNGSPLHRVNSKPPTPPDEPLKTIYDSNSGVGPRINTNTPQRPPNRQSSSGMSGMAASPESLNSATSTSASGSSRNPLLNGNSPMRFDSFSNFSSTDTGLTPPSVGSDNKSDLEALWASFYPPNNVTGGNALAQPQTQQQQTMQNGTAPAPAPALASPNPLTQFLAAQLAQGKSWPPQQQPQQPQQQQQQFQQQVPGTNNTASAPNMAYRDQSQAAALPTQDFDWSNMNNTSIDDFLASLTGSNGGSMDDNPVSAVDDDLFNQQLQQILAGGAYDSTGNMLNVDSSNGSVSGSSKAFSPTNYLNMSPSPLNSLSNSASPQSALVSGTSNSASASPASSVPPKELSPELVNKSGAGAGAGATLAGGHACGEVVNVVDANGNIIKPSDLWVKMGMQHQDNVDNLLIDDLCDQMKAKAKCTDSKSSPTVDNHGSWCAELIYLVKMAHS